MNIISLSLLLLFQWILCEKIIEQLSSQYNTYTLQRGPPNQIGSYYFTFDISFALPFFSILISNLYYFLTY